MDNIVEVDETNVGGKWDNMSKDKRAKQRESGKDNKVPVMGLIEREGNLTVNVIGQDRFKFFVRRHVNLDAQLVTGSHLDYQGLTYEFAGHNTVNHNLNQFRNGIFHTNSIEGFFSYFKRTSFGIYHQISPKHLHRYCDESVFVTMPGKFKGKNTCKNDLIKISELPAIITKKVVKSESKSL